MKDAPKPLPCPRCGTTPVLDYGLSDARFDEPFVYCMTVHLGAEYEACAEHPTSPVIAETLTEWNRRAAAIRARAATEAAP